MHDYRHGIGSKHIDMNACMKLTGTMCIIIDVCEDCGSTGMQLELKIKCKCWEQINVKLEKVRNAEKVRHSINNIY